MKKEQFEIGQEVILGKYKGTVVEINESNVVVQFNDWPSINPWTGQLPRLTFTHYELLDVVGEDNE